MTSLRLEELTRDNVGDAVRLRVRPAQEKFVATVAESLAEAYVTPSARTRRAGASAGSPSKRLPPRR